MNFYQDSNVPNLNQQKITTEAVIHLDPDLNTVALAVLINYKHLKMTMAATVLLILSEI